MHGPVNVKFDEYMFVVVYFFPDTLYHYSVLNSTYFQNLVCHSFILILFNIKLCWWGGPKHFENL
jgi:hypothetical protein